MSEPSIATETAMPNIVAPSARPGIGLVDPELRNWLDIRPQTMLDSTSLAAQRQGLIEMVASLPKVLPDAAMRVHREERFVPGPVGQPDVRVLVYTPDGRSETVLPAYLHIHGGGFVMGSADMSDPNNRMAAADMNSVVVSVDYRLAPEVPFPGPVEDCYAALLWLHGAADMLGIDPARIVVGGESAGAGLAAACCLLARDRGVVTPCFQYLAEPMLDHRSSNSDHLHVGVFGWTRENNRFSWQAMLGAPDARTEVSPYASPSRAADLSGLPPTYIHVGSVDLFLEESLDYALRLARAGVAVELHVWPGAYHAFQVVDAQVSRAARATAGAALRKALDRA